MSPPFASFIADAITTEVCAALRHFQDNPAALARRIEDELAPRPL